MVSFISISQGISFCLLASSVMIGSSAFPVAGQPGTPTMSLPPGFPTELPDLGSGHLPSLSLPSGFPPAFPTTKSMPTSDQKRSLSGFPPNLTTLQGRSDSNSVVMASASEIAELKKFAVGLHPL
ncbi:hypothetical protein G6F61_012263 [Rhizopus arrhizus]|nr:hypothetical protein G6F42_002401 [Rhizopus arrhizus]KAG1369521.1 hypothetical protein G6F61_012263 [Rhizopus arrhizus]